jgi:hypothetical protein
MHLPRKKRQQQKKERLETGFKDPPVIARRKLYGLGKRQLQPVANYYEMEQAKQKGMGGFDIWDVGTMVDPDKIVPDGPPFLSDASLQGIRHAVNEGDRLGLEIGLISSSSWNAGASG